MAKLHIICPVINALFYTRQMVSSIRTSSRPFKITIIDNDSRDGTSAYCAGQEIECVRNVPRKGVAASWNIGIRKAMEDPECEYIFVPNNDVVFHDKTIDNLIKFIDKTGYAMATGSNQNGRISLEQLSGLTPPDFDEMDLKPITNWREEGPDFSCFMITKKTVEAVGYFDENFMAYCEDNDYHYRLQLAGLHARRISSAPYFHYGSMTLAENPGLSGEVSASRSMPYFVKKWGGTPEQCMDGHCNKTPFNDPNRTIKDW